MPTLLFWRITGGVYYEFLTDPHFAQAFGDSFQKYVGCVINRALPKKDFQVYAEERYGTMKSPKDSVDWIISDHEAAIFLECKAQRFSWNSKASLDDDGPIKLDIDNLANAIVQV